MKATIKIANIFFGIFFIRFDEIITDTYRGLWLTYWIYPYSHRTVGGGATKHKCLASKKLQAPNTPL